MKTLSKPLVGLYCLIGALVISTAPAQAKMVFGNEEKLRKIQDVDIPGPDGEQLYLGHKFTNHAFILPYRMTDDGYVLGVRGVQRYFRLDEGRIKSFQARGLLPSPLPPYQLTINDYIMGHFLWIALAGIAFFYAFARRRRRTAQTAAS